MDSMEAARQMFDGYDTGVQFVDQAVGNILECLEQQGLLDETTIIISADHGEALGELNVYGGHRLADQWTCNIPMIIRMPNMNSDQQGRVITSLHYQFDITATLVELLGGEVPSNWDAISSAAEWDLDPIKGREFLVVSQGAASVQRSVRFDNYICIRSYHDGHHNLPDTMLFDLVNDPHEQHDLSTQEPGLVNQAMNYLEQWHTHMMRTAAHPADPFWMVLFEGGSLHTRGKLPAYLERLRQTGRADAAEQLAQKFPRELRD